MNLLVREKATADKKGRALSYKNNESLPADSNKCRIQQAIISKQTPVHLLLRKYGSNYEWIIKQNPRSAYIVILYVIHSLIQ